jgi:cytochrome P450
MFGDGIFTQEGEDWKHSRELLRPQFHFKQYADLEIFREAVDNLIDNIPKEGGVIDLQPLFYRQNLTRPYRSSSNQGLQGTLSHLGI